MTWTHALVVGGSVGGFSLVARRWRKGMHESAFGRRGVWNMLRRASCFCGQCEISWWDFMHFWPLWVHWETEGFVWKLSDSCHQHALHQVDTYVWGWRTSPGHALAIQGGCLGVWFGGLVYVIWGMFAFFGLFQYLDQGSSTFFSCALAMSVIGLLFLRQCFIRLPHSTETSISGTSRKLPLCNLVSQYVYWRMSWRDVKTHAIVIRGFSRVGGDDVM